MKRYYFLVYKKKDFSKELLKATEELINNCNKKTIIKYSKFLKKHFNIMKDVKIEIKQETKGMNGGVYINRDRRIVFYGEPTPLVVLHELRHYIQFNTKLRKEQIDYEEEARSWSCSLFYCTNEEKYIKEALSGDLRYV